MNYPKTILICHDDYHAKHIGQLPNGDQFLLTTPFEPAIGDVQGCEYIALYVFDPDGTFKDAKIENLGPRTQLDEKKAESAYNSYLQSLESAEFCDINVSPFQIERFGTEFGLIPTDPEFVEDEDDLSLEFMPGNFMAFFPPWDGDYDT